MGLFQRFEMPHRRRLEGLIGLVIVLLILSFVFNLHALSVAAAVVAFIALASVKLSTLVSAAWWGLSELIGRTISGLFLTLVFLTIVTPVGLLRRGLRKGPRSLKPLPRNEEPTLEVREHAFGPTDFERPW